MGHTSNALRSRNSAYLAPRPASERQVRLDAGRCASQKTTERLRLSWVVGQQAAGSVASTVILGTGKEKATLGAWI